MATPLKNSSRLSIAMERTGQRVSSQEIPSDVVVQVGNTNFSLHKSILVAKSGNIRKKMMESKEKNLTWIDLSEIPGGAEMFEKAAKFCYGVNFEITVHNVAALGCAAYYLEMTDKLCDNNLAGRTEEFLTHVALKSLSGAVTVLKSCEGLLPLADELKIVQRCVNVASSKACYEANFPTRSTTNWWTEELAILDLAFFQKIIYSMKSRGAKSLTLANALITYTEKSLRDLVRDHSENITKSSDSGDVDVRIRQKDVLETIVSLLPPEKGVFPVNFLCCLLRCAIFLHASSSSKKELEKRISEILEQLTVDDLLVFSSTYDGERLFDLESVCGIISEFVEKEKKLTVFNGSGSPALQKVVKTVDAYLAEIAVYCELSISKFNAIANLVPKPARKVDNDLYRAVDIYLKAHPGLDQIEREKVCSVMDPLKLSHEARLHASQNKRLPVQIVLHAVYHDQLKLRSGMPDAISTRNQLQEDVSMIRENEVLRSELMKMKSHISDLQKNQGTSNSLTKTSGSRKPKFFSSMSKTLGKLNPFKHGAKDTSNMDDEVGLTKPRRRRFSMS